MMDADFERWSADLVRAIDDIARNRRVLDGDPDVGPGLSDRVKAVEVQVEQINDKLATAITLLKGVGIGIALDLAFGDAGRTMFAMLQAIIGGA